MDSLFTLVMVAISAPAHSFLLGVFAMSLFREVRTGSRAGIWFTISALAVSLLIVSGTALGAWIFGLGWVLLVTPLCVYAGVRLEPKIKARLSRKR
jgi:peptidoglycan/LPS O-acetylase OafA/YrhL